MICKEVILWSEYLLVLQLSAKVSEEISAYKDIFKREYQFSNAVITRPHLTLMKFFQYDSYEALIVNKLKLLAETVSPFNVQLENFGTFGHTIYAHVKTTHPILEILYHRKEELKPLLCGSKNTFFVSRPHISIARGLQRKQYAIAWEKWQSKKYHANFKTISMILLKRNKDNFAYKEVKTFYFGGLQIPYLQAKCF